MTTLIVYDSVFGNTEQVAQVIGQTLGALGETEVLRVTQAAPARLEGVTLLVAGSPTRGFRPTEATVKFLSDIPQGALEGVRVAAFDTRISIRDANNAVLNVFVKIFGYAAQPIADRLVKKGGALVVPAEGFFVKGTEGPLKDGERERAAAWARAIAKSAGLRGAA
jgi:flavodoxin